MNKYLLSAFLFSLCYLPAFIPNTSIRIDFVISVVSILFIFRNLGNLKYFKRALFAYSSFFSSANLIQIFFYQTHIFSILVNALGFLRPLGTLYFVSNQRHYLLNLKKLVFSTLYIYPILGIIDYFNIEPLNSFLNLIYRFGIDNQMLGRATGLFQRVHGLAYFNVLAIVILIADNELVKSSFKKKLLIIINFLSLVLTFSRSGMIFIFIVILIMKRRYFLYYILSVFVFIFFILNFLRESKLFRIIDSIYNGVKYLLGSNEFDDRGAAFITARLEWGWGNSISKFLDSPIWGNLDKSVGDFVGDGGYVEILANQGLMGLIGFFILIFWFLFHKKKSFRYIGITLSLLNIGAACFTERLFELLIIYIIFTLTPINERKNLSIY
jgi:hypothetical protein